MLPLKARALEPPSVSVNAVALLSWRLFARARVALASMAEVALTAEVDGAFAGFCIVFAPGADYGSLNYGWFSRTYTDFVYLDRIAVDPAFRRYGIGRGFYAELIGRLTGRFPLLTCEVNVRPYNEASLNFHHSVGFREVGQQDTDGGKKTVSLLALPLD